MTTRKPSSSFALISLALSLIGLGFLPFFLLSPPPSLVIPWQNQLIGSVFTLICIFGIIAGVSPSHCSPPFYTRRKKELEKTDSTSESNNFGKIRKIGHHPTCEHYTSHVLRIRTRILCAGCSGLVAGATLALVGTILFFFGNIQFNFPVLVHWLGWIFVLVGLLQHYLYRLLHVQRGLVRFLVNIVFVVGAFLLLASLVQLSNSLVLGSYLLALILYWIFTRILMSRRSHQRICAQCRTLTCPYSDT